MKKNYGLVLLMGASMCLMLSGCQAAAVDGTETATEEAEVDQDNKTVTMEKIIEANKNENILSQYSSFQITVNEGWDTVISYMGDDILYIGLPNMEYGELYVNNELVYSYVDDVYCGHLYADVEEEVFDADNILFSDFSDLEVIQSCEEKDGLLYVTTAMTEEDTENLLTERGYDYDEGEYLRIEYTLEAEMLAERSIKEIRVKADGTEVDLATGTVEFNVDPPEEAQNSYNHFISEDKKRVVTVIADPDTEYEKEYVKEVPKGDGVIIHHSGDDLTLYADRACTEELIDANIEEDSTVYVLTK